MLKVCIKLKRIGRKEEMFVPKFATTVCITKHLKFLFEIFCIWTNYVQQNNDFWDPWCNIFQHGEWGLFTQCFKLNFKDSQDIWKAVCPTFSWTCDVVAFVYSKLFVSENETEKEKLYVTFLTRKTFSISFLLLF